MIQVKQRCAVLEDQLVDMVVQAMESSENEADDKESGSNQLLWQHLSSQLIFFVLFQFASFPHMVLTLYEKVGPKYSFSTVTSLKNFKILTTKEWESKLLNSDILSILTCILFCAFFANNIEPVLKCQTSVTPVER